jgi:hypothetical protein
MVSLCRCRRTFRGSSPQLVLLEAKRQRMSIRYRLGRSADSQITQELLKARDKRIGVMTELITAIQVGRGLGATSSLSI